MPIRPFDREAHRAALLLVEAVTRGRVRATEAILNRPDVDAVAMETARLMAFLGPRTWRSKAAFLENLRHALAVLDEADTARAHPSANGDSPDLPLT